MCWLINNEGLTEKVVFTLTGLTVHSVAYIGLKGTVLRKSVWDYDLGC
jgi:hypothetical protein